MKIYVILALLLCGLTSFAEETVEIEKGGKNYLCVEKARDSVPAKSLASLCRMAQKGRGETIYHANGRVFTHYAGQAGATWYYDNGKVMTHYAGQAGSTWYYSNGKVLTHYAGQVGSTWYYSNGRVITHYAGQAGATWYYEDGQVMTHSGPPMSVAELMYPCDYIE